MERFKWRLQRVLDIKKKEEQVRRTELQAITEWLNQVNDELFRQKQILEDLIARLSQEQPQHRLDQQVFFMTHSAANDAAIRKLESAAEMLAVRQQEKTNEILTIKRFNDGLEKLREEAEAEFIKEQEKLEQKNLDDVASFRFIRRMAAQ